MSDDKLVKRGELILLIGQKEDPEEELKAMNQGKVGRPFTYIHSLIWTLAVLRVCLKLPYRQLAGFTRRFSRLLGGKLTIDPSTVYRRIKKLVEERKLPGLRLRPGGVVTVAVDSTGLKVGNYGEWMRHKWKRRRGFLKLHLVVDVETRKILGFKATSEEVPDARAFPELLYQAQSKAEVEAALGDGAYDTRDCFNQCSKRGVKPLFRVRKNASTRSRGSPSRAEVVREVKRKGYKAWAREVGFGRRWAVETAIGSFKAMFGEYVAARTLEAAQWEVGLKVAVYNQLC
ncbi:MAG: IS5 family transposase [Candidatus Jordarchaeaceae archaeon]